MTADEPDIAALFAPVDVTAAVLGVLGEAGAALTGIDDPVDAELWGSDVIGALSSGVGGEPTAMAALADVLVPAAADATAADGPVALGVLRILEVLGDPRLRATAGDAAALLVKRDTPEPAWTASLGSPRPGTCWHYADVGGRQESVTLTFAYGRRHHAISVLIDHTRGGKVKDIWLTKGQDQLLATELAAGSDPMVVFELLDSARAADRVRQALAVGEHPELPDQADGIAAHRAILRARLAAVAG